MLDYLIPIGFFIFLIYLLDRELHFMPKVIEILRKIIQEGSK